MKIYKMEQLKYKMGDKKYFFLIVLLLFSMTFVYSMESENRFCCEKTYSGATCQNIKDSDVGMLCDSNGGITETSCSSTSFCRTGTCIDTVKGKCVSSPKITCEESGGTFVDQSIGNVMACQKGCCLLGSINAMFVSSSECSYMAANLGSKFEFNPTITSQLECLSLKNTDELGACVATNSIGMKTCKLKTRADCNGIEGVIGREEEFESTAFYAGYLCSSSELATNCTRQSATKCDRLSGMETPDVYWVDSCGNRENIVFNFAEKGGDSTSHNGGKIITDYSKFTNPFKGNCDYYSGTQCNTLLEGDELYAEYSNVLHHCKSTNCLINGVERKNGESWCETDENAINNPLISEDSKMVTNAEIGNSLDLVGQEYYLCKCILGDVIKENCGVKRKEICISTNISVNWGTNDETINYSIGQCIPNVYSDCTAQTKEYDCLNRGQRYCRWVNGSEISLLKSTKSKISFGDTVIDFGHSRYEGVCLPMYSIGDDSSATCSGVQVACEVEYGRSFWGAAGNWWAKVFEGRKVEKIEDANYEIISNGKCIKDSNWMKQANEICVSSGDCGFYTNVNKSSSEKGREGFLYTGEKFDVDYSINYNTLNNWINEKLN